MTRGPSPTVGYLLSRRPPQQIALFDVHWTTATPKRISNHLPRQSPLSFTTNCVSAARPTRRRRAQSDVVSICRFFENGTQQLLNILEQYILRSLRLSGLTRMPYETRNRHFIEPQASQTSRAQPLATKRVVAAVNDGNNQNRFLNKFNAQRRCAGSHFRFCTTM